MYIVTTELLITLLPIILFVLAKKQRISFRIARRGTVLSAIVVGCFIFVGWLEVVLNTEIISVENSLFMSKEWWTLLVVPTSVIFILLVHIKLYANEE